MLYACDCAWWQKYRGVPAFSGLKLTADRALTRKDWGVHRIEVTRHDDRILVNRPGVTGWGGNSGFQCLNLAVQFGAAKIILVGYDMRIDKGVHWHGLHEGLNNPTERNVSRWRRVVDDAAGPISAMGIKVINASAVSALENYRKMDFREALEC
ncbi:hypothetical protein TM49_01595 [Martelella endophytica]|uniref:Uncharacterized protein n=1 Tax=Martelella endophytica TaxID=1486262 RepID=A0A0D5LKE4_MAREN|nr:hypothetical protein TM49_01595 [Martelella endophytica]